MIAEVAPFRATDKVLLQTTRINPKRFGVGISYGIATKEPQSEATIDDILAIADQALMKVKAAKHPERANSKRDEPWRFNGFTDDGTSLR